MMWRVALWAVTGLALVANAQAGGLAPTKASQLVEIVALPSSATCPSGARAFDVLNAPDGTTSSFSIPAGKVLVLSDVAVRVQGSQSLSFDLDVQLQRETASASNLISESNIDYASGKLLTIGLAAGGVEVKSGVQLCVKTTISIPQIGSFVGATAHGFLAPDK